MKTISEITNIDITNFLSGKRARVAKSKKYVRGERVTPTDTPRKEREYIFVTSMRWTPFANPLCSTYGGYILLNPRTGKLISCTNIERL